MNLLPRSAATLALAVSAVPGVAPLAAHVHPQQHAAAHTATAPMHQGMPGGWMPQNVNSPSVLHAATFAVGDLSRQLGGQWVVETVEHAQSQVVQGTNIQLKLRIARVQDAILGARKECTVTVWSKPSARASEQGHLVHLPVRRRGAPAAPAAAHPAVEQVGRREAGHRAAPGHGSQDCGREARRAQGDQLVSGKIAGRKAAVPAAPDGAVRKHEAREHAAKGTAPDRSPVCPPPGCRRARPASAPTSSIGLSRAPLVVVC